MHSHIFGEVMDIEPDRLSRGERQRPRSESVRKILDRSIFVC